MIDNQNDNNQNSRINNLGLPNLVNLTNTLQAFQRSTNEEILSLFRRVLLLRDRINFRNEIQELEEEIYEVLFSNIFLKLSPVIIFCFTSILILEIKILFLKAHLEFKTLESEDMWIVYGLAYCSITIIIWSAYLLIFKSVIGMDEKIKFKLKSLSKLMPADILHFNPFYFNILIFYLDKQYISTNFDFMLILNISTHYFINYFFTYFLFNYIQQKISAIQNLNLNENKILTYKMRLLFFILILLNLFNGYFISIFTEYSSFKFIYFMTFKSFYLLIKQLSLWYENEISYKNLDNFYSTNEQNYLNYQFTKMCLKLVILILILFIMIESANIFLLHGAYLFFFPCLWFSARSIFYMYKVIRNYIDILSFIQKLEASYLLISFNLDFLIFF
jgi:hypothetical protein